MFKKLLVFSLAFLFAFSFIAADAVEAEELEVWIGGHVVQQEDTWAEIMKDFEEEYGIEVDYQLIGFDVYYDRLTTAYRGGEGPDIAFADLGGWVPTFAQEGWIKPLDDFLDDWDGTDNIWDVLWSTVEYEGTRYGVPWYTDARVLLYNQRMFDDAGIEAPPETWDELVDTAVELTDPAERQYGYGVSGKATEVSTLGYIMFLFSNDGQLLTDDYSEAAFNTEEGVEALRFYTDLYLEHEVSPPGTPNYGEDEYREMMAEDQIAMAIGGPWSFPLIEEADPDIRGNYGTSVHPYGEEAATVYGGWASVINAETEMEEEAKNFIEYTTSYDVWMEWVERHEGPMPAREDVSLDAEPFQDDPRWETIFEVFPDAGYRPPIPEWPEVSDQVQVMIQNVLIGEMTVEEAVENAEENINDILD